MGVILGTGTNAAYVESASKIPKLPTAMTGGVSEMIVNIEWGAFDNEKVVLPVTKYDLMLDSMVGLVSLFFFLLQFLKFFLRSQKIPVTNETITFSLSTRVNKYLKR